ncbi:MAG: 30S ribosomal protein S20 [Bdellovibrionota bacterium]|nr:30S ribosomal protein S20 [Bdellovibrionota bacterium]
MANHKSAKKRSRQTEVRNARNTAQRSAVKTAVKNTRPAIAEGNKEVASKLLLTTQKLLDRLSKKGIIKPNTAARRTSRLASQVNKL